MLSLFLAIVVPLTAALAVTHCLVRRLPATLPRHVLQWGLSVGFAWGLPTCGMFFWLYFVGIPGRGFFMLESFTCLAIALAAWSWQKLHPVQPPPLPATAGTNLWLALAFAATLVVFSFWTLAWRSEMPHGFWDAWDNWNVKARLIFRGPEDWRVLFDSSLFDLPDYPLLVPLANARLWMWLGHDSIWIPWLTSYVFTLATVAVVSGSVGLLRGNNQGLLAGSLLLVLSGLPFGVSSQYADLPLVFYFSAALAALIVAGNRPAGRAGWLIAAGLSAGLAAWTKNEGLVFAVLLLAVAAVLRWKGSGIRAGLAEFAWLSLGAAVGLAACGLLKGTLAPATALVAAQESSSLLDKVLDWRRHAMIVVRVLGYLLKIWVLTLLAPAIYFLWGRSKHPAPGRELPLILLLGMALAYYAIYLITPYDFAWHIINSIERLSQHLWPLAVLFVALDCASPDEVLDRDDLPQPLAAPSSESNHTPCTTT